MIHRPQVGLYRLMSSCSPPVQPWGALKPRHSPPCRERPQPSPNRQLVNRPTFVEVPLTGLPFIALALHSIQADT